ncbi:MAG: lasso RiPP family leader peptide-containing protein [Syntrophobacterales bacterium]|nr:lasso RiPP family leader peptide-containing protein [Syntrophobacterales bacterium]
MTPQVIELGRLRELTQKGSLASPTSITWKGTSYKQLN